MAGAGAGDGGAVRERGRGGARGVLALVSKEPLGLLAVDLEVFPEGGGVCVRLVAALHPTRVRLVGGVHVHVLLPVAGVGEPPVAALDLALKRLLAWKKRNVSYAVLDNQTISNEFLMTQCIDRVGR